MPQAAFASTSRRALPIASPVHGYSAAFVSKHAIVRHFSSAFLGKAAFTSSRSHLQAGLLQQSLRQRYSPSRHCWEHKYAVSAVLL